MKKTDAEEPLLLRPAVHPLTAQIIQHPSLLPMLLSGMGSPLNVLLPDLMAPNVMSFQNVLQAHGVKGRVFFAHKPNQAHSLMRQLSTIPGADADVASLEELRHALASGFVGTRIQATGPKNAEFLSLCLLHNVIINVDSIDELALLINILKMRHSHTTSKVKVLLRLCGFDLSEVAKSSRFGILPQEREAVFELLKSNQQQLEVLGFSFHLDSISLQERLAAISTCIQLIERGLDLGFSPRVIDIGGGFKINYLAQESDWHRYTSALKQAALGRRSSLTWHGANHGLRVEGGQLRGSLNSYGYYERRPGAMFLNDLLSASLPGQQMTVGTFLSANMIELWVAPGLALLDQAGFTVARVNGRRQSSDGHPLVMLAMKRSDVVAMDAEPFVDPIMLYNREPDPSTIPVQVFFAGNLCLESDLVYRHLTHLPKLPEVGDLVVFPNTAGYRMDFSASNTIMQPVARKVAVCCSPEGNLAWMLDEQYSPVWTHYLDHKKEG